jgi:hypothetical protein
MPAIESGLKMTWVTRERLKGFPVFQPAVEKSLNTYETSLPPVDLSQKEDMWQHGPDWESHEERPDIFEALFRTDGREKPEEPNE